MRLLIVSMIVLVVSGKVHGQCVYYTQQVVPCQSICQHYWPVCYPGQIIYTSPCCDYSVPCREFSDVVEQKHTSDPREKHAAPMNAASTNFVTSPNNYSIVSHGGKLYAIDSRNGKLYRRENLKWIEEGAVIPGEER